MLLFTSCASCVSICFRGPLNRTTRSDINNVLVIALYTIFLQKGQVVPAKIQPPFCLLPLGPVIIHHFYVIGCCLTMGQIVDFERTLEHVLARVKKLKKQSTLSRFAGRMIFAYLLRSSVAPHVSYLISVNPYLSQSQPLTRSRCQLHRRRISPTKSTP